MVLKRGVERVAYNVEVIFLFQEPGKPQFYHVLPGTSKSIVMMFEFNQVSQCFIPQVY